MMREIAVGMYGICYYVSYPATPNGWSASRHYVGWTPGVKYADAERARLWVETGEDVGIEFA